MRQLISIGQIFDKTWDIYSEHFKTFMKVTSWLFLAALLLIIGNILSPSAQTFTDLSSVQIAGYVTIIATTLIVFPVLSIWVFISLVQTVDRIAHRKKANRSRIYRQSWRVFVPYVLMTILRSLIFILPVLLLVIPGPVLLFIAAQTDATYLNALGLLLFLIAIPAAIAVVVFLGVHLAFPGYEMILEEKGIVASLKSSYRLVKKRFWATLWRLFVPKLIIAALTIVIQILLFAIIFVLAVAFASLGDAAVHYATDVLTEIGTVTVTVLTAPLYVIIDYLIFESLHETKS